MNPFTIWPPILVCKMSAVTTVVSRSSHQAAAFRECRRCLTGAPRVAHCNRCSHLQVGQLFHPARTQPPRLKLWPKTPPLHGSEQHKILHCRTDLIPALCVESVLTTLASVRGHLAHNVHLDQVHNITWFFNEPWTASAVKYRGSFKKNCRKIAQDKS
eukprot:4362667-Amphidinium_carterae.1